MHLEDEIGKEAWMCHGARRGLKESRAASRSRHVGFSIVTEPDTKERISRQAP